MAGSKKSGGEGLRLAGQTNLIQTNLIPLKSELKRNELKKYSKKQVLFFVVDKKLYQCITCIFSHSFQKRTRVLDKVTQLSEMKTLTINRLPIS